MHKMFKSSHDKSKYRFKQMYYLKNSYEHPTIKQTFLTLGIISLYKFHKPLKEYNAWYLPFIECEIYCMSITNTILCNY